MSLNNNIACPMYNIGAERISEAMSKSESTRSQVATMASKVEHLEKLPTIATAITNLADSVKSLNRNNTLLLLLLGALLLVKEIRDSGYNLKASGAGASVEMTGKK